MRDVHQDAELAILLAEVERFLEAQVAPHVAHPELPMPQATLAQVLRDADAMGLASADDETSGLGLWEDLRSPLGPRRSLAVLQRVARLNAGLALALHQRALARALVRELELVGHGLGPAAPVCWGHYGIGREALARLLAAAPLSHEDRQLLADVYALHHARLATLEAGCAAMLWPIIDEAGAVSIALVARSQLELVHEPLAHGLDELITASVRVRQLGQVVHGELARRGLELGLHAQSLALVAIALGTLEAAHIEARAYAATRAQGGCTIDRHPAVLQLLANGRSVLDAVDAALLRSSGLPVSGLALHAALSLRAWAHAQIGSAIHGALQVFGGLGYMRDVGLEKRMRDANHLRALVASPRELALVVAEWERLRG